MNNFSEYVAYFRHLAEEHVGIKEFVVGNSDKILNLQRSELDYPALWLEYPNLVPVGDEDSPQLKFRGAIVILNNTEVDNWHQQDFILNETSEILIDLMNRIEKDCEEEVFEKAKFGEIEPISSLTADNDYGWRVSIDITINRSNCVKDCQTKRVCPAGALARFSYDNKVAGGFTDLLIVDGCYPIDHNWNYLWTWTIDGAEEQTSTDLIPLIDSAGKDLYIQLDITDENGCTRTASANICSKEASCGQSVPYCYKMK